MIILGSFEFLMVSVFGLLFLSILKTCLKLLIEYRKIQSDVEGAMITSNRSENRMSSEEGEIAVDLPPSYSQIFSENELPKYHECVLATRKENAMTKADTQ
jgi:hypothetical protein